jgi:phage terminase Nu1 subunit (DNA packaging protein)
MTTFLSKNELARRLGCSERILSIWQREGLPIAERGHRGNANRYSLRDVLGWLKLTGRGQTRVGPGQRPIDVAQLERELALETGAGAKAAGEDILHYLAERAAVALAARFLNEGCNGAQACDLVGHVFEIFFNVLRQRYHVTDANFCLALDECLHPFWDDKCADHQHLLDRIYKEAAAERARLAPQLPLEGSVHARSPEDSNGPAT